MIEIAIDIIAGQRVPLVLAKIQEQVPAADEAYALKGALGVGLNFLLDPVYRFVAADFAAPGGQDDTVEVTPIDGDADRAQSLADDLSVDVTLIYSAALCTGLARLLGSRVRLTGPFSIIA